MCVADLLFFLSSHLEQGPLALFDVVTDLSQQALIVEAYFALEGPSDIARDTFFISAVYAQDTYDSTGTVLVADFESDWGDDTFFVHPIYHLYGFCYCFHTITSYKILVITG